MRRRILLATVGVVLVALVAFAVPLAVVVSQVQEDRALDALAQQTEQLASIVRERARTALGAAVLLEFAAEGTDNRFTLVDATGAVVADSATNAGPPPGLVPPPLSPPARAHRDGSLLAAASVPSSELLLLAATPDRELLAATRRSWLLIAALGAAVLAASAGAAAVVGRRSAQPVEELAAAARRLADGDFTSSAPRSGLPEADTVADALDETAERLGSLLARSQTAATDASHQLRTPLTALRLELEALRASGADEAGVAAAERAADRLERTVEDFLALTRPEHPDRLVDVSEVAAARTTALASIARAAGREVVFETSAVPALAVRSEAVGQALQVLLDNALTHGRGRITVTVFASPSAPGRDAVRLEVSDEGPGWDPDLPTAGGGRGLALARSLVEAEGGRLWCERRDGRTVAALVLPVPTPTSPTDRLSARAP